MLQLTDDRPALPERQDLIHIPVGMVSPLWAYFAGVALSGVAFWSMTRWAKPENLEAFFAAPRPAPQPEWVPAITLAPEPAGGAQAAAEAVEAPIEAAAEAAEALSGPPAEAAGEAPEVPVGGEAAPISPVVAAAPPKARRRAPEPRSIDPSEPSPDLPQA